jgi:hypothetical protein
MIRLTQWTCTVGGTDFRASPLTVRQRLALSEELATERARAAAEDARLAGMGRAEAAEHIGEARRKAMNTTALYLDAYSLKGALRILTVSMGSAEIANDFSSKALPRELSRTCLEALGIDTDTLDAEDEPQSGNA